jgi:hypothetical protein
MRASGTALVATMLAQVLTKDLRWSRSRRRSGPACSGNAPRRCGSLKLRRVGWAVDGAPLSEPQCGYRATNKACDTPVTSGSCKEGALFAYVIRRDCAAGVLPPDVCGVVTDILRDRRTRERFDSCINLRYGIEGRHNGADTM